MEAASSRDCPSPADLHASLIFVPASFWQSLGWLTESSLMPKKAKEIEQVGKASMLDLKAQLYRSEESLKQTEGGMVAAAAQAEEKRKRERRADMLGAGRNQGVSERSAADAAHERQAEARACEAMARKVEAYEAMRRGECEEHKSSLVDFELKQLRGDDDGAPLTLVSADMAREAERVQWEAEAASSRSGHSAGGAGGLQRYEQRRSSLEKRLLSEVAEETEHGRCSASEQKQKRHRAVGGDFPAWPLLVRPRPVGPPGGSRALKPPSHRGGRPTARERLRKLLSCATSPAGWQASRPRGAAGDAAFETRDAPSGWRGGRGGRAAASWAAASSATISSSAADPAAACWSGRPAAAADDDDD